MALCVSHRLQFVMKNSFYETKRKICLYNALNQNKSKQVLGRAINSITQVPIEKEKPRSEKISRAMVAFLQRQQDYVKLIQEKENEFNIGKRHLAKIMGLDPFEDKFEQRDVNRAISYLLPSGLSHHGARPFLKHPTKYFPRIKELDFDNAGRPNHYLFYTMNPKYYEIIGLATDKIFKLDKMMDEMQNLENNQLDLTKTKYDSRGSAWIKFSSLSGKCNRELANDDYLRFINVMERLLNHPLSKNEEKFLDGYRIKTINLNNASKNKKLIKKADGTVYVDYTAQLRTATVKVELTEGSGTIKIIAPEGTFDILYFPQLKHREQLLFPFKITDTINNYNISMTVNRGGMSCIAKAARYAISKSLCSFLNATEIAKMRIAGLLTNDRRVKERKKPGRKGARRSYTWKKR